MIEGRSDRIFKVMSHIVMVLVSLAAVLPMLLLAASSLTENAILLKNGYSYFPEKWTLDNYKYILENSDKIFKAYSISIVLTVTGTTLGTAITVLLGYGLSRPNLPGKSVLMIFVVVTMLFNGGLVPTYMNYSNTFHLKNTFLGLLIPGLLMNGFNVMLVKSYFTVSVPQEIMDAAEIDGASEFRKFSKVALPLAVPIIATIALFVGIAYWNDWNNGYIYLSTNTDLYSIQNLLNRMQQNLQFITQNASTMSIGTAAKDIPSEGVRMAISVLGVLPILIVYPFVQRFFIKGITLGGVKG